MSSLSATTDQDGGLLHRITAYFLPDDFGDDPEKHFRARVVVAVALLLAVASPIYAVVAYWLTDMPSMVVATAIAVAGVCSSPFWMKKGWSLLFLGNWMTLFGTGLFIYVASQQVLGPAVLMWQVVYVVLVALIAGTWSALGWLVVMSVATVYFYLQMISGVPGDEVVVTHTEVIFEMSLVVGMFATVLAVTLASQRFKDWALNEVQRQEAHTRAVLESAPDGIITVSEDGRIENINTATERLFNYERDDIDMAPLTTLLPEVKGTPGHGEELADGNLFEKGDDGEGLERWSDGTYEADAVRRDGTRFPAEVSVTPIEDEQDRFVAIVRDITVQKEAQRALREARDRAVEANESKSRFLANTSHELRTPLNAIIGYSELVGEDLEMMGEEGLQGDVVKIKKAGEHLLSLINEVLDLAKLEAGKMDLCVEEVELEELVEELSGTVQPLVEKNNNTMRVDIANAPRAMQVDRMKLRQILLNLLSNACKFTEDAHIRLHAFQERRDDQDWCVFEVIDRGIGIEEEKLEELFEAFTQADLSTTRDYGGTGLGLTICKKFTELMGGEIGVESELGEGSTFRVKLPVNVNEHAAVEQTSDADESTGDEPNGLREPSDVIPGAPTVLVIDDDATVHQLMERFLAREGFNVETSTGGEKALQQARRLDPDIITLDVLMPEVDGWSMLEKLKADDELVDIPVVMLTIVSERNMGFSRGADDYLTKPVDTDRLVEVLTSHIDASGNSSILIAEDDDHTREILSRIVEDSGFEAVRASDGQEALDMIENGYEPSAILLDLMMPRLDGFELLHELRGEPDSTDIPVIVVSAADLSQAEQRMIDEHAERLFRKGEYVKEQLMGEIRAALK